MKSERLVVWIGAIMLIGSCVQVIALDPIISNAVTRTTTASGSWSETCLNAKGPYPLPVEFKALYVD